MKKHLLVISQYFYPEQFRINDLCKEWVKRGYEVTVVTGIPNYPTGKFFEGYSWLKRRKEEYEGVHIVRLPLIPRGKNSLMLAISSSFVKRIEERKSAWRNGKSKVKYWPQYAEEFYKPVERKPLSDMPEDDSFKIAFTGNIGYAQGLDILPKVAKLLEQKQVNCSFIIIGDGRYRKTLEKEIREAGVENMFHMLGRKKPEEIPYYLVWCDTAFISFADNPLFEMTIPAKLQSYMACEMPMIAVALGETEIIINEAQSDLCCKTGDSKEFVKLVIRMNDSNTMKKRAFSRNSLKYAFCRVQRARISFRVDDMWIITDILKRLLLWIISGLGHHGIVFRCPLQYCVG